MKIGKLRDWHLKKRQKRDGTEGIKASDLT